MNKITIFLLIFVVVGSQAIAAEKYEKPPSNQTEKLGNTLETFNIDYPEEDVNKNITEGDHRFLCVCGFACYTPGVEQQDYYLTKKYGIRCLDGTSDMVEGDEHMKLINSAREYAAKYNHILLIRLKKTYEKP